MKYEFEIFESDLADRTILIEMRAAIEERIAKLSDFGRNTLVKELNELRGGIQWCENVWLHCQREKAVNKLSEVLNADRDRLGDKEWHDD